MLSIRNFSFVYPYGDIIYKNAELSLTQGLWLLDGHNGSGKSTLLNALANVEYEKEKLRLNQDAIVELGKKVMLIKNDLALPNTMEIDSANYVFWLNNIVPSESYEPIYNDRKIGAYSLGEKRTATFHILSYLEPDVLLIDEYLNNLDQKNLEQVLFWLQKIADNGAVIIVASNEEDIKDRFDLRIRIDGNKLIQNCNPQVLE